MENPIQALRFYRDIGEEFFIVVGDPVDKLTFGGTYKIELWHVFHFEDDIIRFDIYGPDFTHLHENTVTIGVYTITTRNNIRDFRRACRQYSNPPHPRSTVDP